MGEDLERVVLAWRQWGLASNFELYLVLADNDLFNAPCIGFPRSRVDIHDETIPKMCAGLGVVHPVVLIIRRSGFGSLRLGLSRRGSISKVHAEVERKESMELEEEGRTIGTIDPPTKIGTTDPSIENRCFVLA
jgi:hypothetical protein